MTTVNTAPVALDSEQSPTLGALAGALAKAQAKMTNAAKDSVNPHFKSRYADLASVWDACREALTSNGLAVMQRVSTDATGVIVTTQLLHASGEWVKDRCLFPVAQRTPQGIGAAITYGRRYALAALVGVAAGEDDDGNADSQALSQGSRSAPSHAAAKDSRAPSSGRVAAAKARAQETLAQSKAEPPGDESPPDMSEATVEPSKGDDALLDALAKEFGTTKAKAHMRVRGANNGKTGGYTVEDISRGRSSLQAVPAGAK